MSRSLNKVTLIGNLTRDPELRYTPAGTAVCTFGIATNRQWTTDAGEKKEDVEFHRIVAWRKLAEICAQLLKKGNKAFVEGRLQTRKWTGSDGMERTTTEVVISDMIILDSRGTVSTDESYDVPDDFGSEGFSSDDSAGSSDDAGNKSDDKKTTKKDTDTKEKKGKDVKDNKDLKDNDDKNEDDGDDIPF